MGIVRWCVVCMLLSSPLRVWAAPAPRAVVCVPHGVTAPVCDGKAAPGEWDAGVELTGIQRVGRSQLDRWGTTFRLMSDAQALYVLADCPGDPPAPLPDTSRDGEVWLRDSIELFIQRDLRTMRYAHFLLAGDGGIRDELSSTKSNDVSWNPDWVSGVCVKPDGWTAEIAIPWSVLGGAPQPGMRFRIQLARNIPQDGSYSWAPCDTVFHEPDRFADARLTGSGDRSALVDLPQPALGRISSPRVVAPDHAKLTLTAVSRQASRRLSDHPQLTWGDEWLLVDVHAARTGLLLQRQVLRAGLPVMEWTATRRALDQLQVRAARVTPKLQPSVRATADRLQGDYDALYAKYGSPTAPMTTDEVDEGARRLRLLEWSAVNCNAGLDSAAAKGFWLTQADGLTKVQPDCGPVMSRVNDLQLEMARGEYEPLQLIVNARAQPVQVQTMTCSDLVGRQGGCPHCASRFVR